MRIPTALWMFLFCAAVAPAQSQEVARLSLEAIGDSLTPGANLVIEDGVYRDVELVWKARASEDQPIVIRAQTPGGVVIAGKSSLEIDGAHITVRGLAFQDGHAEGKEFVSLRGEHQSLIDCAFLDCSVPEDRDDKWVGLRGEHHRVANCTFSGKTSKSNMVTVWRASGKPDHHVIEGNHFDRFERGGGNGYETIRIGTSDTANSDSFTTIRGNLFTACDGEMEIISVKSGKNLIEQNTFIECAGTVTLRHGNGTVVTKNIFAGKRKKETGGIRVIGEDHVIAGNAFIGTTARAEGAIALLCADTDSKVNGHQEVKNVVVEGNLLVANEGYAIVLDGERDQRPELPRDLVVRDNVMSSEDVENLVRGLDAAEETRLQWSGNQIFRDNQIPSRFTSAIPQPLTQRDVGASWLRK